MKENILILAAQIPPNLIINTTMVITELSRRDFLKAAGTLAGSVALAACAPGESNTTPTQKVDVIPTTDDTIMFRADPEPNLFNSPELIGDITTIKDVPSEVVRSKYTKPIMKAIEMEGIDLSDPNIVFSGVEAINVSDGGAGNGNDHVIVFFSTKTDESTEQDGNVKSFMYLYAGIDNKNQQFVPPNTNEGKELGRIFPIAVTAEVDNKITYGIGKPTAKAGEYELTVPLCQVDTKTGEISYIDPYSGHVKKLKRETAPQGIQKVLAKLIPVAEPAIPAEVQKKFDKAGIDINNNKNIKIENGNIIVTYENNTTMSITASELEKRVCIRRDNILQFLDNEGKVIESAYDPIEDKFIQKVDHVYYPENKILDETKLVVIAPEKAEEAIRQKKLLFKEYPIDVWRPDPNMINTKYGSQLVYPNQYVEGKYSPEDPLGPGSYSMITPVDVFIVDKDPANGRPYQTVYILETIALGDTMGVMQFVYDIANDKSMEGVQDLQIAYDYILPATGFTSSGFEKPFFTTAKNAIEQNGLITHTSNDNVYFVFGEELIKSFKNSALSPILENTPMYGYGR